MAKKQVVYFSIAILTGVALFSPAILEVHADQATNHVVVSQVNNQQQIKQKLDQDSVQLNTIKNQVQGTDYEKPVDTAINAVDKMKSS
ncbi:TPA: hypothetical protein VBL15_001774, partial [Streptococcus agalactiae]|nr:hypothetical protein [Streptococcus agalactiae]